MSEYKSVVSSKLNLKGIDLRKKKKKKRKKPSESEVARLNTLENRKQSEEPEENDNVEVLTAAQKRYRATMKAREQEHARVAVRKTHREKVEDFNYMLGELTEHNDIPRVSAAGNG
uniref:Protein FAM32A n=1 Tax=Octactis speculum TaxID=3111310 RepID=A0A7S2H078_9STRA|mmetsp:Transcript_59979/g.82103  ORF Transcript_59979/g.82103 Transcript_59979/m.82103 type:complete len:116 (+) Transcript_59979:26-373(+)